MSETSDDNLTPLPATSELESLRARADQMGIEYHHNTGVKKLKAKIHARLNPESAADYPLEEQGLAGLIIPETAGQRRVRLTREAGALIRVRVTNMNPNKKEYEGEIYTVSNSVVGTFRKYVPFNAEDGWHVPKIMLEMMKEKECQVFYTIRNERNVKVRKGKIIKELAIEYMNPLTQQEINVLGASQAARMSVD